MDFEDDRITCSECRWLARDDGRCRVADKRREKHAAGVVVEGSFPRSTYRPVEDLKRRCEFFGAIKSGGHIDV